MDSDKPDYRDRDADTRRAPEMSLIDVGRMARGLRERWFGTLVCIVVCCGALGYLLLRRPPVYAATATLLIERSTDRVVDIKQVVDNTVDSSLTDALLLTHIQRIRSHSFMEQVVASFTPEEREQIRQPYIEAPQRFEFLDKMSKSDGKAVELSLEDLILSRLKVDRTGRTLLITVDQRHRDPAIAQLIANRVADQYIVHLLERSSASNDTALTFLSQQAGELRKKLEAAELKAQTYREAENLVFVDHSQSIGIDRIRTLNSSATQARVARLALEARLAQVQDMLKGDTDLRQLSSIPEFSAFAEVQKRIDDLRAKGDSMADRYGRRHPAILDNASSIETLERLRKQQIAAALGDLKSQRDKMLIEEEQLRSELAVAEKQSLQRDQLSSTYNVLRREADTIRETYSQIQSRLNETSISSRLQNTNVKVVSRAALPTRPVEPDRVKTVAILGLLGAFMVVAYPWSAQMLDKRIRGSADIETVLGGTLIGELPMANNIAKDKRSRIVADSLDLAIVEGFRAIYSQFRLASRLEASKVVLITSTIPGEGKSFVACNLAASFAAHGSRTLLIDADLRRPTLHTAFGLDNQNGILAWLKTKQTVRDEAIRTAALGIREITPGLFLLRAGGESNRLTELLQADGLRTLIAELRQQFETVVIDTSPAGVFPDAEAFSSIADELVYVCRFKAANRNHARQTIRRLARTKIALRGIILNAVPGRAGSSLYMSSYGQGAGRYRKGYAHAA